MAVTGKHNNGQEETVTFLNFITKDTRFGGAIHMVKNKNSHKTGRKWFKNTQSIKDLQDGCCVAGEWRQTGIKTTSGGAGASVNGLIHVVVAVAAKLLAVVEVRHDIVRLLRGRGRETANQSVSR